MKRKSNNKAETLGAVHTHTHTHTHTHNTFYQNGNHLQGRAVI